MKRFINLIVFVLLVPFFLFACNKKSGDGDLLVYDHNVVQYNLPISGYDVNKLTVSSSNPDLFTVSKVMGSNNEVLIESNLNNLAGSGEVIFTYNNEPVNYKLNVNVKHPSNMQEAMDAFSLAAIKLHSNKVFNLTFNFLNNTSSDNFELSLEIYARMGAIRGNYHTGSNITNAFQVNTNTSFATTKSGMIKGDKYYLENFTNLNYRWEKRLHENNETFYIDTVKKTLDVDNSEELFWAVEHGYRPIINDATTTSIYNAARTMCANNIKSGMSELEKFKALYEALDQITHYDYWVLDQQDYWFNHKAYFLEGVFLDSGKAVCDGFAKAYALLCGIVGLPCFRSYGFYGDSGHSWNYIMLNNNWYLTCPTWCKVGTNQIIPGLAYSLMDYEPFATDKNYFYRAGGSNYSDLSFPSISRSSSPYSSKPITSLFTTTSGHTFHVTTNEDASAINTVLNSTVTNYGSLNFTIDNRNESKLENWINIMLGNASNDYEVYVINGKDASYMYVWLIFISK